MTDRPNPFAERDAACRRGCVVTLGWVAGTVAYFAVLWSVDRYFGAYRQGVDDIAIGLVPALYVAGGCPIVRLVQYRMPLSAIDRPSSKDNYLGAGYFLTISLFFVLYGIWELLHQWRPASF